MNPSPNQNIDDLYLAALEQPSDEARRAYLNEACGDNNDLRRRVERLLAAQANLGSFLESPAPELGHTIVHPLRSISAGDQIGPYKLLERIGEGGMGSVFMAEQLHPVRRRVALKVIKPGMDSRQVLARFEAERHALSLMDHPHIARVLDAGTTEGGRPYFVMELVKGQPITEYCDALRLSPRERLSLFLPVCHAIQHAHQKGVIHRDIKPSNVLVAEYDGLPVAKVIDFGVAKAMHQPLTDKTMFTGLGQIIGTLEYMSPEQARVNQLDIDTRSDVYSLGVLLYELLTGSTPFDRQRLRDAAWDELLRIIREEEPARPSHRLSTSETLPSIAGNRSTQPAQLSKLVGGELDWMVMKALEKDRNRRYETANGLALDIQRYLADEPVSACPPSARYRFEKFARRNRAMLASTTLVAAALVLGLIATTWQGIRATRAEQRARDNETQARSSAQEAIAERDEKETARREALASAQREAQQRSVAENAAAAEGTARTEAEAAQKSAVEEAAVTQAISDFLQNDLLGLAGLENQLIAQLEPDPDIKLSTLLDRALAKVDERFANQPRVRASIQATLAKTFTSIGRYDTATTLWEQVQKHYKETLGPDHPDTLGVSSFLASSYADSGQLEKALLLGKRILESQTTLRGTKHRSTLISMSNLAWIYHGSGQVEQAISLAESALELQTATLGMQDSATLQNMLNLPGYYMEAGEYLKAIALAEKALELNKSSLGLQHPNTLAGMSNLTLIYQQAGQLDKALSLGEQALKVCQVTVGRQHPMTLSCMDILASVYADTSQLPKALSLYQEALDQKRQKLGADHPSSLIGMNNLALAYSEAGQVNLALPLYQEAFERLTSKLGPEHPDTLRCMTNLSRSHQRAGQLAKALSLGKQSLALQTAKLGLEHPDTLASMNELAMFHLEAGQWEEAVPWGEQALQLRKVKLGQDHPDTLTSMVNLATIYLEARQLERAQQLLEESLALQKNRLGNENPNTLICMGCLAMSYFQAGQLDTARSLGERTLELMKNQLGPDHPHTLISMNNLAMYYWYSSQPEKALPLFDTALQLHRATLGSAHPNTLQAVSNLVEFYKSQQDNAAALNRLQQVMESAEWQSLEKEARQRFQSDFLVSKAMCLNRLDRSEDAEAAAREALQLREATMPDTCKYFQAMSVLGESLAGQKRFDEAEPLLIAGARGILSKADEIPAIDRTRFLQRALQRVITLYEVRNQPDSARPWQDELERLETSSNSPSP